jgi:hypothetical protein
LRQGQVDDHPLEQIQELENPEFMARFGPSRQADGICDRDTYDGRYDVAAESAQLKRAQRERVDLDLQIKPGELVNAEDVVVVYQDLVREVRQAILGIPARVQGDLSHMVPSEVEVIKRQCRETLAELKRLGGKPPRVEAGVHRHAKRVLYGWQRRSPEDRLGSRI